MTKRILNFLGSQFDTLLALMASAAAVTYGVFNDDARPLLVGISIALGVLSFGLIRDRFNREALGQQIKELKMSLPAQPSAIAFFRPLKDFDIRLKNAFEIDLCGVSLTNTLSAQFATLRSRIEAGAKLRILVIDPESHAIEMTSERSTNPKDTMYYQRRLESTFSELTYLYKFVDDMQRKGKKGSKRGHLSVKMLSYAPSFGLLSLDSKSKEGIIQIEIFPHKFGFKARPIFSLSLENDGEWYTYFVDQFEHMWNAAKSWDPSSYMQKIPFDDVSS
jgi:hypothetical protein